MAYSKKISIFVDAMTSGARRKLRDMETSFSRLRRTGTQATSTLASRTKDFASSITSLEGIARIAMASVGVHYAKMAAEAIGSMARVAAKNLDLQASFETLASRHRLASDELIDAVSAAAKGTVDKFSLMLEINKALRLGVADTVDDFVALMKIAVVRAKEFGLTTKEAWGYLVTAIGRASPMIADNIGILLDANATYDEYARSIGTTADKLDKLQQKEAIRQRILREGIPDMEAWIEMGETAATVFEQYDAVMVELRQELAESFLPAVVNVAKAVMEKLERLTTTLNQLGWLARYTFVGVAASLDDLADRIQRRDWAGILAGKTVEAGERAQRAWGLMDLAAKDHGKTFSDIVALIGSKGRELGSIYGDLQADTADYRAQIQEQLSKAADIWADYGRAVARENERFARRVADAQFRATQAAENAAFQRGEILRRAQENRSDAIRDFQHSLQVETQRHHLDLQRMTQDHFDRMADLEYSHEKQRSDLMRRAPWWIRNALKKEFAERERIAKTGDKKALSAFDKTLLERIRAIDPAYAKELDLLLEKHEHEAKIEEREASKSRTRRQEDWNIERRELDYRMRTRLQDIERDLQNQLNAWRFHDQQRRENERRAMENLRADHNRALHDLREDTQRRLADFTELWKWYGQRHGESYIEALQRGLRTPVSLPTPGGDGWTPAGGPPWAEWQRGAWEIPRTQLGVVHKGEMIVPAGPAEALREGGGVTIIIENLQLGGGGSLMDARIFGDELGEYLGRRIQQQGR